MIDYELGQVVKSTAGHDCGKNFIVINMDEKYLYLVDGRRRRIESMKKKKKKHIQITHQVAEVIANRLQHGEKITNADIRNSLKNFQKI